jgi:tetratricopeptide (TPR) repeat protein
MNTMHAETRRIENRLRALLSAGLWCLLSSGPSVSGGAPATTEAPFDCDAAVAAAGTAAAAARDLATHTFSLEHLRCAAATLKRIADAEPGSLAAHLDALAVYADYLFFLDEDIRFTFGLMVEHYHDIETESVAASKAASADFRALLERAGALGGDSPSLLYFEAVGAGIHKDGIPLLERVIATDPSGLGGSAYARLGETYYTLPDLLGGNLQRGIENLRKALEHDAANPRALRLLSRALEEGGDAEAAVEVLARLARLEPRPERLQATADELRNGIDLAGRLGASDLADALRQKREALLRGHPYLMTRKLTSLLMHSGEEHPLEAER